MIQPPRDLRELFLKYIPAALAATGPVLAIAAIASLHPVIEPRSAGAALAAPSDAAAAPIAAPASAAQQAAQDYAEHLRGQRLAASPFHHPVIDRPAPQPTKPVAVAPQLVPRAKVEFKLSAIVGGRETIAVLNGKVRRKGDDVGQGWIVQSIDREAGLVTLRHPQEGTQELTLKAVLPVKR